MNPVYLLSAGLEILCAVFAIILLMGCYYDHERKRITNRIFAGMLLLDILVNLIDAVVWLWVDDPKYIWVMKALIFFSYGLGCFIFALFSNLIIAYIKAEGETVIPKWILFFLKFLTALMLIMWIVSLFNDMYYYWDEDGICQNGSLFLVSQLFGVIFLAFNMVLVWMYRKTLGSKDRKILIVFNLIPLFSFAVSMWFEWEAAPLYIAFTISMMLFYTIIHVEHGQRIAEQETRLVKQELELQSGRTAMMLSQIQPHFLYNSLTAIAQLCVKNPEKAKETILSFSDYLRQNMNSLNQKEPIAFSKALEHMKIYLSIEQIRFGDLLKVTYDIEVRNFLIPALCLQPMVENAVKHGIRGREEGGTVSIFTRERREGYQIIVKDNGVGFDPSVRPEDGRTHIGIANVRERLQLMVNGTMEINSEIGKGTIVTITIPKENGNDNMGG